MWQLEINTALARCTEGAASGKSVSDSADATHTYMLKQSNMPLLLCWKRRGSRWPTDRKREREWQMSKTVTHTAERAKGVAFQRARAWINSAWNRQQFHLPPISSLFPLRQNVHSLFTPPNIVVRGEYWSSRRLIVPHMTPSCNSPEHVFKSQQQKAARHLASGDIILQQHTESECVLDKR